MSQIDLKLGPKIKAFRRQSGLQANKLAEKLNISPSYLTLIEGGKRKIDADLLVISESSILSSWQNFSSKSASIFLFPPSINVR